MSLSRMIEHVDWLSQESDIPANAYVHPHNKVIIERPVSISKNTDSLLYVYMGRNSYYQSGVISPNVIIGRYSSIAHNVYLGASQHPMDHLSTGLLSTDMTSPIKEQEKFTTIGCDVWIGLNAVIMSGVKVGHGAIIGAGAIVTKEVPPYAVVAGVPAKIIKYRFDKDTIEELLLSKWWEFDPVEVECLPKDNIEACIAYFREKRACANLE